MGSTARRRKAFAVLAALGLALIVPWSEAAVVQIDVSALFDADVVVNNGSGSLDPTQSPVDSGSVATGNFAFPTQSVAMALAPPASPSGLPDDASFAASAFHPVVVLGWRNDDDGFNAVRLGFVAGSFSFQVPPASYQELHLFATAGDGDADLVITLGYADTTTAVFPIYVPDWFDDPVETAFAYVLINDRDRIQPGSGPGVPFEYQDRNDPAIFGIRIDPDATKTLESVTVERTDALGVLTFYGATGVTTTGGGVNLYESIDPATVRLPANLVATNVTSPHLHVPAPPTPLYYQADDGQGAPARILLVKRGAGIELTFP